MMAWIVILTVAHAPELLFKTRYETAKADGSAV